MSLSNSAPQGKLTMDTVKDSLFNKEAIRNELGNSFEVEALVTQNRVIGGKVKIEAEIKIEKNCEAS